MRKAFTAWSMAAAMVATPVQAKPVEFTVSPLTRELAALPVSLTRSCIAASISDAKGIVELPSVKCIRAGKFVKMTLVDSDQKAKCYVRRLPKSPEELALNIMVLESGPVWASLGSSTQRVQLATLGIDGEFNVQSNGVSARERIGLHQLMREVHASCNAREI